MSLRRRFKRFKGHVADRLDTLLLPRHATQSSASLSNATAPDTALASAIGYSSRSHSEDSLPSARHSNMTNPSGQGVINSPDLRLPQTASTVVSLSQHASTSDTSRAREQTASLNLRTSVLTSSPAAAASTAATLNGWKSLQALLEELDRGTGVFYPLKKVAEEFIMSIEMYKRAASSNKEFEALQRELEGLFKELHRNFTENVPTVTSSMESLCRLIIQELESIQGKQAGGATGRRHNATEDSVHVLQCYRRIQGHLKRLSLNSDMSKWKIADEERMNELLDRLYLSSACYNSAEAAVLKRRACTPGTRVEALTQMHGWVYKGSTGSVFWLNGMAGTGKTTIAYSLCTELEATCKLGASFFCSRALPGCRDVKLIIPSIAYQLAQFSRPFRFALSQVLEKDRDVHTRRLPNQFESLIVNPLIEARHTLPEDLVVVIDALDECDDQESTGRMLDALFTKTQKLPIKFLASSRPEPQIRDQMEKHSHQASSRLVLHELDKGVVQEDIARYLGEALASIHPTSQQITTLVQRAGILFIYAATVVRYITHDGSQQSAHTRLEAILNVSSTSGNNPYNDVDEVYTLILKAAIDDPELNDTERGDIKQVLYAVLCAREPLTISALSGLLEFKLRGTERVQAALRPLWSVLHVVEAKEAVSILHTSFPDYIFDSERSKEFYCDLASQEYTLARCCFDCIQTTKSRFNICGLQSSHIPDAKVLDLKDRINRAIPSELSYSCRYWASHLGKVEASPELLEYLEGFLSTRLLLWMEVMNVTKQMHSGVEMMRLTEDWCMRQRCSQELMHLAHDGWRFVTAFTSSTVSQSTPHIYLSMLPFWPESYPIAKCYGRYMQVPIPYGPAISRRQLELLATWLASGVRGCVWSPDAAQIALVVGSKIIVRDALTGRIVIGPMQSRSGSPNSIGYSCDGIYIVSGSTDGTIRIWHTQSGEKVFGPLKGHTDCVTSVSFSSDGTRVVSGSQDHTICIWDAQNGKKVLGPLKGHTDWVNSVAFSPDSTHIISGSGDNTIRVWDARSGLTMSNPLRGHTNPVLSVAFSPDGTHIVSGSSDNTIRIWDIQHGQTMLGPLEGHIDTVTSVAFSPKGTRVVSGSYDSTIRIWDVRNGQTVLGPLTGHTDWVNSVAFSPDDTRIMSSSNDNTVRFWDARAGQTALHPLQGHTKPITSVAFSPDGTRIASGSHDETVRSRDAQGGQTVLGPLKGHTDWVNSVAFSPDGTRLVSGSDDYTILVWNTQNGIPALDPLEGHTSPVLSVAFSPDNTRIVSGSCDRTIRVWGIKYGRIVLGPLKGHTGWVNSVAFSPDSSRIVSGSSDNTIRVWDARSGLTILGPLGGHTNPVLSVAFSPDGSRIVSGSRDKTIRVWATQSGQTVLGPLLGHTNWVKSVSFSPDSSRIASGSDDNTIRIWDTQSGQTVLGPLERHTDWVNSVVFSPNGTRIASGSRDGTVYTWDTQNGQIVLGPLKGHTDRVNPVTPLLDTTHIIHSPGENPAYVQRVQGGQITPSLPDGHALSVDSVAFSPDGTRIVSGSDDNTICIYDTQGQTLLGPLRGHTDWIKSVAFSADGTRIVSGSLDNTIRVWDTTNGQTVLGPLTGHTGWVLSVAFSPDPDSTRIISGSGDNTIRIWDARNGQAVLGPLKGHTDWINSVVFSPQGTCIASGSNDYSIRFWDAQNGKTVLGPLEGHTHWVISVAFSPDGSRLVSGSSDNKIRVWDTQSGQTVLGPLEGHTDWVNSVAFSPDSTRIVSGSGDNEIRIWDTRNGRTVLGPLKGHSGPVMSVSFSPEGGCIVSGSRDCTIRMWDVQSIPTTEHLSAIVPHDFTSWHINKDGWVVDESRLIVWVPPDLHHVFQPPRNIFLISTKGYVQLRLKDAHIGKLWTRCYQPV